MKTRARRRSSPETSVSRTSISHRSCSARGVERPAPWSRRSGSRQPYGLPAPPRNTPRSGGPPSPERHTVIDQPPAELDLHLFEAAQAGVDVPAGPLERPRQRRRVLSCLAVAPAVCGRTTNAASPSRHTRPKTVRAGATSTIVCRKGWDVAATNAASIGCTSRRARSRRSEMAESGVPPNGSEAWCWRPSRSTRIRGSSASLTPTVPDPIQAALPGGGVGTVARDEVD